MAFEMKLLKVNKNKSECNFQKFQQIKNKILILRECGGYGDILNMRMIFQDLKEQFPEFEFDWAIPYGYFHAASNHPYIKNLIPINEANYNDYLQVFNLSYACTRYEWKNKKDTYKNRADIWANYMGMDLKNHNMFLPDNSELFPKLKNLLVKKGWDQKRKIIIFTPFSALPTKNFTQNQISVVKKITKDYFLIGLHNLPMLELNAINIPSVFGLSMQESMALIQLSDIVITTDTGHLHCSGGYNKPTLALFCYTSGKSICKYYNKTIVVQVFNDPDQEKCGPCYTYTKCTRTNLPNKPCRTEISEEMIIEGWEKLLNSYI